MKAHFIALLGNKFMTEVMNKADLFEDFKALAYMKTLSVEYKEGINVTYERAGNLIKSVVEAIEKANEIPIFVHLMFIEGDDIVLTNKTLKVPYFRNDKIKVISTGHKWLTLDDFIEQLGIKEKSGSPSV